QISEVRYKDNNSLVEKYWYDSEGRRIKKENSAGELTYYINKYFEIENGTVTTYFFRDDERVAKQSVNGTDWYLPDHLGSTNLLVNENGSEVERSEYFPYGQVQSGGSEKYGFTGQENDANTELMYYGARYYSPEYRIFIQPDTMLPSLYNPQALNRYSYTLNNPVKYTDPSGHYVESALDIAFIAYDINQIMSGDANAWDYLSLGADLVCLALPVATGGGLGVRAVEQGVKQADNVGDLFKWLDTALDVNKADNTVDVTTLTKTTSGATKLDQNVPEKAYEIAKTVKENNGKAPTGYKGGRQYNNDGRNNGQVLPDNTQYKEYDINPYVSGNNRGPERIVVGDDGSVWYTNDHYQTFTQIE
ncbi:RHS repeat-associated protein, partial [Methanococcus maripaludis]